MDGVLLDSEEMKLASFRNLFLAYPDKVERIDRYNHANQGIPRRRKIKHVLERILGLPADPDEVEALAERYGRLVMSKMDGVALLPGVRDFLQQPGFRFFVNSSAPIEEIEVILEKKEVRASFEEVFGFPATKREVLEALGKRFGKGRVVFFGDAPSDLEAARSVGVPFVGVDGERGDNSPFAGIKIPTLRDFTDPGLTIHLERIAVSSTDRETHSGSL